MQMASRFSEQGDEEQNSIQVQFNVLRAKDAIVDLTGRVESLHSMGRLNDADAKELLKMLKTISEKIEKPRKKK